jgi:hypothetical protein
MMGKRARCAWAVAAAACWALATSAGAQTWVQDTWRQTTYYRASFAAAAGADGQLRAAAADSYAVFLNGTLVGADTTAARMRSYPVRLVAGTNHLAVVVSQRGRGVGSGLILSLATDSVQVPTTTDRSVAVWRWTATPQEGAAWRTATPGSGWQAVQSGSLDTAAIEGLLRPVPELIAGFPAGADVGSAEGGIRLKRIQGENLALAKSANRVETVDGDLTTAWEAPVASLNFTASVDLRERYLINRVRVLTKGPGYADNSLRGYSVQVSDDQVRWSEVAAVHGIADYRRTEVSFAPTWTRYVRIVIVEINAITQPRVAELEVYGDGYVEDGAYVSAPLALGAGLRPTNFGRVAWEATIPARTGLSVQFRTGNTAAEFAAADTVAADSGWSAPLAAGDVWFPGQEPGRLLQYRVHMRTDDERRTPVFRRLQIDYAPDDVPVSRASTWVAPNEVPMGRDTTFTCAVDLAFAPTDLGVERLQVVVPSEAALDAAGVSGAGVAVASWQSGHDTLTVRFAVPLRTSTTLLLPFRARTLANVHRFRAFAFSPGSSNPLNIGQEQSPDPGSGRPRSWQVLANAVLARTLSQVRAAPAVFTPNGDGVSDDTVIEFALAKVEVPRRVSIRIVDLAGRTVAQLRLGPLAAGAYQRLSGAGRGPESPGWWDGRAAGGERVPPGIYLYRVEVDLDSGSEVRLGTVAVVY